MNDGRISAVLGAQYGSEGKGVVVTSMADEYDVHVRVGSPNAGHTFSWRGEKHVMQTIPCGWTNPDATILIGRGALINMEFLLKELVHIEQYYPDFRDRLVIDAAAGILDKCFCKQEGGAAGEMHRRIGSTGEGVGPARQARLARDPKQFRHFYDVAAGYGLLSCMREDTPSLLEEWRRAGKNILLEGTQGSALSLLHSYWPYCTSIDTNAAAILSEVGIAPARLDSVVLVARTFPIRVAGNSGPMENETDWTALSLRLGHAVEEKTTVTRKVRRVAEWDDELIRKAIVLNAPTSFAIQFMDYLDPAVEGASTALELAQSEKVMNFLGHFQRTHGIPVSIVGTGGPEFQTIRLRREV